jgi:hypothetical protein
MICCDVFVKKPYLIAIIVIGVLLIFVVLNELTLLTFLNEPLNKLVSGTPIKSCSVDSDCKKIPLTTCTGCACTPIIVNKDWNTYCPFKGPGIQCQCAIIDQTKVKCIDNLCTSVSNKNPV